MTKELKDKTISIDKKNINKNPVNFCRHFYQNKEKIV